MADDRKMLNPYEKEGIVEGEVRIPRGLACGLIAVFVLILLLPPLHRNVYQAALGGDDAWVPLAELFHRAAPAPADDAGGAPGKRPTITEHLNSFETQLEEKAAFTEPPRQFVQGALAGSFREGNRKTYIGRDGWLYLKPALDAMTGYGPITPEPDSVAKDPNREPWAAPLGAIRKFAGQLEELGVELTIVPIPVKPMIYPEHVTGKQHEAPVQHRDAAAFYEQISALPNVRVLDLSSDFWAAKADEQLFLKQDTHWTPAGMQLAVEKIAASLPEALRGSSPLALGEPEERASTGDLVDQLELPGKGLQWFLRERVTVRAVPEFVADPTADITLLGDSFANIYSSEALDWGAGAGLPEHLSRALGRPIDVIAINGQASTGVRRELARRGREHLSKKKHVIWAIAARDLFLSETAARESNVIWGDVAIPEIADTAKKPGGGSDVKAITVTGRLISKSKIADPTKVTYKNALFVSEFGVEGQDKPILVKEWAFRDKQLTPASAREIGAVVTFELIPFDSQTEVKGEQEFDDYLEDIEKMLEPRWWPVTDGGDGADGEPRVAERDPGNTKRANLFATIACLLAILLVAGLARWLAVAPRPLGWPQADPDGDVRNP